MKETYGDTSRRKIDPSNADPLARPFLQMAYQNLESARELYKIKNYPDAVFLLQQAIEKTTKSYALYHGFLDEKAVKIIAHHIVCIFEINHTHLLNDITQREKRYNADTELYSYIDNYKENLEQRMNELEQFRTELYRQNDRTRHKRLSQDELNEYLFQLEKIEADWTNIFVNSQKCSEMASNQLCQIAEPFLDAKKRAALIEEAKEEELQAAATEEIRKFSGTKWNILARFLRKRFPDMPPETEKEIGKFLNDPSILFEKTSMKDMMEMMFTATDQIIGEDEKAMVNDMIEKIPGLIFNRLACGLLSTAILLQLLNLAIPVSRHVTLSRYPEPATGFNPIDFYTPNLPLVASFSQLADHTERCISNMNYLFHQEEGVETTGSLIAKPQDLLNNTVSLSPGDGI